MIKYTLKKSKEFKKGVKKLNKDDLELLRKILNKLLNDEPLESKYKDHALKGNLKGIRDCHIRPDLILLYEKNNNELILTALRIGKHSELGLSNDR
ncbi:type II toxin-antitoxin system mRNA interferase toxin, HP0892 family [Helicobacter pylori]